MAEIRYAIGILILCLSFKVMSGDNDAPLAFVFGELKDNGAIVCWLPNRFPSNWSGMHVKKRPVKGGAWQTVTRKPVSLCGTDSVDWECVVPNKVAREAFQKLMKKKIATKSGGLKWRNIRKRLPQPILDEYGSVAYWPLLQAGPENAIFVGLGCFVPSDPSRKERSEYGVFPILAGKALDEPVGVWNPYLNMKSDDLAITGAKVVGESGRLSIRWKVNRKVIRDYGIRHYMVWRKNSGEEEFRKASRRSTSDAKVVGADLLFEVDVPGTSVNSPYTFKIVPGDIIERYRMRPTVFEYKPIKKK